jgi:hypothetical protein
MNEYYIKLSSQPIQIHIDSIYTKVFRSNLNDPGFVLLDFGISYSSSELRRSMIALKNQLSRKHKDQSGYQLFYQWMGRFDQQETTKFHLDNAADQSFLMLGYEPTEIESRLYIADYLKLIKTLDITAETYFDKFNPMYMKGEDLLSPYTTEVKEFKSEAYKIVLINNSNTKISDQTLGVFHKAEIIKKDVTKERVINSIMLYSGNSDEYDSITAVDEELFIETEVVSKLKY